jgi:putative ABC transport system ATP-binding protein
MSNLTLGKEVGEEIVHSGIRDATSQGREPDTLRKPMIELDHVAKVYRTESVETHALRDVSLRVSSGEWVALTGPSGSGKTTLLSILGLLESFTSGSYSLGGENVTNLPDNARSRIRNRKIGFVFQSFNLIPDLDVRRNVELPLLYANLAESERRKRVAEALARVGLSGRASHYPRQLSGGQQQRVAIARALAGHPALLLADEPTGNLDSEMAAGVIELFQELHRDGATIIMATHDPDVAARAQRGVRIFDGVPVELERTPV